MSCLIRHWAYPVEKQETDQHGKAGFLAQPIGYMDKNGNFCPYDYLVRETKAASGYMLSEKIMEFSLSIRMKRHLL